MKRLYLIFILIILPICIYAQYNTNNLKFNPIKIYDFFSNNQPNCIINNGSDVSLLTKMINSNILVIQDTESYKYNLANYNIICIGNANNNVFIKGLTLPYYFDEKQLIIGDSLLYTSNMGFIAVSYNPYNLSNRLLHISNIKKYINNYFFDNSQFILFNNDSIVKRGHYHSYLTQLKKFPNKELFITEKYSKTNLSKPPQNNNITINKKTFNKLDDKTIDSIVSIISNRKAILLGENHYFKNINELEKKIILSLNNNYSYPYVFIEKPYSFTKPLNTYLEISDESNANKFFNDKLSHIVGTKEDSIFYNELRIWNGKHRNKKIHLLCTDIEHSYKEILEDVLFPQINDLGIVLKKDSLLNVNYLNKIKDVINVKLGIDNNIYKVLSNVIISINAYNQLNENGYYHFSRIRQEAILSKLEDSLFFSSIIKDSKFIYVAGSNHVGTKNTQYLNPNSEGYYFQELNKYTRGLTYSIRLLCMGYYVDKYLFYKKQLKFTPYNYIKMVNEYKRAFNIGSIKKNDTVCIFNNYNSFIKQIMVVSKAYKQSFYFYSNDINKFEEPCYISFLDMKESNHFKDDFLKFDLIIVVPFSKVVNSR